MTTSSTFDPTATNQVLTEVQHERTRQHLKWGQQNHPAATWLAILTEEVGELAQATLADQFGTADHHSHSSSLREEATQVAAVAVAWLEHLNRTESH
ncbi:hypothetical protein [Sciscionella marina]|uniref:hypothetical protein n=1 Tax=Sciscionella marina TaxID=508770 RepID=UPI000377D563|nr:hypothetical protein [Sciscionella marina]